MSRNLIGASFFSGAGGLDEGFKQAGFSIILANDVWPMAASTYKLNNPDSIFLEQPIQTITNNQIQQILHMNNIKKVDVLIGGPPCQCYTRLNNNNLSKEDKRNELFREYMRMIRLLKPEWVVMENVPDMLVRQNAKGKRIRDLIMKSFHRNGYQAKYHVFELEKYGVPQKRRRVIFLATRTKNADITFPEPDEKISVIKPFLKKLMKHANLNNNEITVNTPEVLLRIKHIPPGGYYEQLPEHLKVKKVRDGKLVTVKRYGSYYRRLHENQPAVTITANYYIHPTEDRYMSNRELATLHTFPINYEFVGGLEAVSQQIANAVPPEFARRIALHVKEQITKK